MIRLSGKKPFFISLACIALAVTVVALPAHAKSSGFKTGVYKATGGVTFSFKVAKGTCYSQTKKKQLKGYCLKMRDRPRAMMDCPDVQGAVKDHEELLSLPSNVHIPSNGRFNATLPSYTTPSASKPATLIGETKFSLKLGRTGRGSGSISSWSDETSSTVTVRCETGTRNYSAKR